MEWGQGRESTHTSCQINCVNENVDYGWFEKKMKVFFFLFRMIIVFYSC